MAKLDWRKAKSHESDPARAQSQKAFVEPDQVIVSRTPITQKELSRHLAKRNRESASEAQRWPSRTAAKAKEAEKIAEEATSKARREALRESGRGELAGKNAAKKVRRRPA